MKVETSGLTIRYGGRRAVDDVDLTAAPGEVLGLLGPNGSGKSSLVRAVAGLVPYQGSIAFDGGARGSSAIGYMPQDIGSAAALTVLEVVLLGRLASLALRVSREDVEVAHAMLADLGIDDLADREIALLSGGQRQLVFLAQALASNPTLLLLDEPISALDMHHQLQVLGIVRRMTEERRLTTILILHDLNAAARFTDAIAVLDRGRLAAIGRPMEVITEDLIAAVFRVEASVVPGRDGRPVVTPLRAVIHPPR